MYIHANCYWVPVLPSLPEMYYAHTDIKPPTMVNVTGETTVREHSSVSYQCVADGFPVPDKM